MAFLPEAKTEDEVKKTQLVELRKSYVKLASIYNHLKDTDYLYCHKCNQFLSKDAFYKHREYASGYFPICNRCLAEMATDYNSKTNTYTDNKEKTKEVLHMMNLPYLDDLYNSALRAVADDLGERTRTTAWKQMITMLQSLPNYRGKTWKDSKFEEETVRDTDDRKARPDIIKIFGTGFTDSDYLYLQDQYDDWRARTQVDSKSQETLIVQICFKQLEIWKAQKEGRDSDKLIKSLNDLMGSANLQPRQNVGNAATDSLTFGQLIEKWEQDKPIPEPSPEFKDVDGIGKYIRVWFSGHLAKALGLQNAYSSEYEEELAKYTVEKPDVNEDNTYETIFGNSDLN